MRRVTKRWTQSCRRARGAGARDRAAGGVGGGRAGGDGVSRRRRDLAHRLDGRPRQPEPVHRGRDRGVRGAQPHVRPPLRLRPGRQAVPAARRRAAHQGERRHLRGRAHLDRQDPARGGVAGRRAADRRGRRLQLQPHHRERPDDLPAGGQGHQARRGRRRHHRALHHVGAQGGHAVRDRLRHPGARLGQGQAGHARAQVRRQAAHHRQRPLPGHLLQARRLHGAGAQPALLGRGRPGLGRRRTSSASSSRRTPTPTR